MNSSRNFFRNPQKKISINVSVAFFLQENINHLFTKCFSNSSWRYSKKFHCNCLKKIWRVLGRNSEGNVEEIRESAGATHGEKFQRDLLEKILEIFLKEFKFKSSKILFLRFFLLLYLERVKYL